MVRAGMARPVVIPKKSDLTEDIVLGVCRTIGLSKKRLLELLNARAAKKNKRKQF